MWLELEKVASEREMHGVIRVGKAESKREMHDLGSSRKSSIRNRDSWCGQSLGKHHPKERSMHLWEQVCFSRITVSFAVSMTQLGKGNAICRWCHDPWELRPVLSKIGKVAGLLGAWEEDREQLSLTVSALFKPWSSCLDVLFSLPSTIWNASSNPPPKKKLINKQKAFL